jgi:hypothetical protein
MVAILVSNHDHFQQSKHSWHFRLVLSSLSGENRDFCERRKFKVCGSKIYPKYISLMILVVFGLLFTNCGLKYLLYTETGGVIHFKFEYARDYNNLQPFRDNSGTTISLRRELVKNGWFDKFLVIDASKGERDIQAQIEKDSSGIIAQFKTAQILGKSEVIVNGITGQEVVISYDKNSMYKPLPDAPPPGTPPVSVLNMIYRIIYFNSNGFSWIISISSTENVSAEAQADFEHVIKTFKILK